MVSNEEPLPISISEHHGKAGRTRYCLAISNIGERVVTRVDANVPIAPDVCSPKDTLAFGRFPASLKYSAIAAGFGATVFAVVECGLGFLARNPRLRLDDALVP